MEIALSRKTADRRKVEEAAARVNSAENSDQVTFSEHFMDTPVEIEGFGKVWWAREGGFILTSDQLIRFSKFNESQDGRMDFESTSLNNGTFLVKPK